MTDLTELKDAAQKAAAVKGEWFSFDCLLMTDDFEEADAEFIADAKPSTVLALIASIEAVNELHKPEVVTEDITVCAHCRTSFPCHTARAVSGAA